MAFRPNLPHDFHARVVDSPTEESSDRAVSTEGQRRRERRSFPHPRQRPHSNPYDQRDVGKLLLLPLRIAPPGPEALRAPGRTVCPSQAGTDAREDTSRRTRLHRSRGGPLRCSSLARRLWPPGSTATFATVCHGTCRGKTEQDGNPTGASGRFPPGDDPFPAPARGRAALAQG